MARKLAPFADKHKIQVAMHGHDNMKDPNQFAKPESFEAALQMSKYFMINLDIGHFVSAGYDPDESGGRIIRVDMQRSSLFALGVNVPLENGPDAIKADLLIGPDGMTRAIRVVQ